jgi:hypothetical protein
VSKSYCECMEEITAEELYRGLLAHGMFTEKLPPIFTAEEFCDYVPSQNFTESKGGSGYIYFESMRDINIPRSLGIPNPMAYQKLCRFLSDNWDSIKEHFKNQTEGNRHKISRIHIRKMKDTYVLFKMNYKNWKTDDSPVPEILVGKKYAVSADISTCFPSMYTHALGWALAGKEVAKQNRKQSEWFNKLDHICMNLRNGETHGFIIGPHASNLLSEIILTVVDRQLSNNGWEYIRNIDDYTCYVATYEEAQKFLTELASQLRVFDLPLNHKKTKIEELPMASTKHWVRQLNSFDFTSTYGKVNYKKAQAYLDLAVGLMSENDNNAAILNYAIKVLEKQKLTENATKYCLQTLQHFAVIYPYLIPLLDEHVFKPFGAKRENIEKFANIIFEEALKENNYEALTYAIYFSLKYDFDLQAMSVEKAIENDSCLLKCFTWCYYSKREDRIAVRALKDHAKQLREMAMDENWLFIYEALPKSELKGDWKLMKAAGVSFIREEVRN